MSEEDFLWVSVDEPAESVVVGRWAGEVDFHGECVAFIDRLIVTHHEPLCIPHLSICVREEEKENERRDEKRRGEKR